MTDSLPAREGTRFQKWGNLLYSEFNRVGIVLCIDFYTRTIFGRNL